MANQQDLFQRRSDHLLIDAWIARLTQSGMNLTTKTLGLTLAWRAIRSDSARVEWQFDLWGAANLNAQRPLDIERMDNSLLDLVSMGFIKIIRSGGAITHFELLVTREQITEAMATVGVVPRAEVRRSSGTVARADLERREITPAAVCDQERMIARTTADKYIARKPLNVGGRS